MGKLPLQLSVMRGDHADASANFQKVFETRSDLRHKEKWNKRRNCSSGEIENLVGRNLSVVLATCMPRGIASFSLFPFFSEPERIADTIFAYLVIPLHHKRSSRGGSIISKTLSTSRVTAERFGFPHRRIRDKYCAMK